MTHNLKDDYDPMGLIIRCPKCGGCEWGASTIDGKHERTCHNMACHHVWTPGEGDSWVLYEKVLEARERVIRKFLEFMQSQGLSLTSQERQAAHEADGLIERFLDQDEADYSVPEGTSREGVGTTIPGKRS